MPITQEMKDHRKAQDLRFLKDTARWPGAYCCVKSQPWEAERKHGIVYSDVPTVVHNQATGDVIAEFKSLEDMVEHWSVD